MSLATLDAAAPPGPLPLSSLAEAARRLQATPSRLHDRLVELRADPEQLAALAKTAYRHSNGFVKTKLFEDGGTTLRLHVWPQGEGRGDTDPHGHRWEFASWVAAGVGIRERYYAETEGPDGEPFSLHRYARVDGTEVLQHVGRRHLQQSGVHERATGQIYECSSEVVHTVEPMGKGIVVTAVLQGRVCRASAPVYRRLGHGADVRRFPVTPGELRELLGIVEVAVKR